MPNDIPTETVCKIVENSVFSPRSPRQKFLYKQFIFYRWRDNDFRVVGYLMLRDDQLWQAVRFGGYYTVDFESRDGQWRRIRSKMLIKESTRNDPELIDRRRGERECLFGLQPFGDVRG